MTVLVIQGDDGGCGHYRMRFPAEAVRDVGGLDVIVMAADDVRLTYAAQPTADGTWKVHTVDVSQFPACDVIVMQRPLQDVGWQFIRILRAKGYRVVVDVDDDFDRLHPNNPAARLCASSPRYSPANIHRAIAEADACTVSTPALADRYRKNGTPIHILRNMVPAAYLDIPTRPAEQTVGWTGSVRTHHSDLTVLGGALGQLQQTGWNVKVVGRADRQTLGCVTDPAVIPWMPIRFYPAEIGTFTVGIVPLKDTVFNQGKSWLKGLEYAALDVPFAATPSAAYLELNVYGLGVLVEKPKQWRRAIEEAAGCGGGRRLIRANGLTYEDRWSDWANVWSS